MKLNSFQIPLKTPMQYYSEQNAELTYVPKTQNGWFTGTKTIIWDEEYTTTKTNCCNCGAPLYKNKCEYCGTINRS